ncbi:MAG: DUF86 domain-containing protein [Nanoarchaeota archaeon]
MRIDDKIEEIENYLSELGEITPDSFQDYINDFKTKAACERYFEKIIEAVVDLTFLIIKDKGFKTPGEDKEAFDILAKEKIISKELADRLKDAKSMRNIIAHEYGKTDDRIIFESITEELEKDVREFISKIVVH